MADRTEGTVSSLVGDTIISLRVADLRHHARNRHFFGDPSAEADAELRDDIARQGLQNHLVVCGKGCTSPEGTILRGHRRYDAVVQLGYEEVPAVVRDRLSADEELDVLLGDNVAANCARRLKQSQLYAIEEAQRGILARRAGQRSDLAGRAKGETSAMVAAKVGQPENAVRNRQKVFGSAASPPELRAAVDAGRMSLTAAAKKVRELEMQPPSQRIWPAVSPQKSRAPQRARSRRRPAVGEPESSVVADGLAGPDVASGPGAPNGGPDLRSRIRSAAENLDLEHRRLLGAVSDLFERFPGVPPSGPGTAAQQSAWARQVEERWQPLVAATSAFVEMRQAAADLFAHAIGALEALEPAAASSIEGAGADAPDGPEA